MQQAFVQMNVLFIVPAVGKSTCFDGHNLIEQ